MKFQSYFVAPFYGVMVLLVMAGCSDEDVVQKQNNDVPQGNGIVFDASANYVSDAKSRTQYGDYEYGENGEKISQVIEWLDTDHVDIYSPQSPKQQVEYGIQTVHSGQSSDDQNHAWLLALGDGLQWDRSNATQDFYAVYPSKNSMSNTAVQNIVSFENGVLTGYVPINQQHTIKRDEETGAWTAEPNMDYLYMAAINEDFTIPADGAEQDGVNLDFVPLTTTLEITIKGPTTTPLASLNVQANGVPVVGHFTCDLVNGNKDSDGVPVCVSTQQGTTNDYATVSLYVDDKGTQKPLSLTAEESVTLNVFLLPTDDLSNVTIRIAGFNTSSRTMVLQQGGTNITLHPHKKTCVTIPAPEINAGGTNEWITGINGSVLVSQLSIPGTANSFSYMRQEGADSHYQTQTATITEQWNAGIRCFELRGPNSSSTDLADAPLQCNRQDLGITFGEAVRQINELLQAHQGEFAMIMPAFESGEGRFVEDYASDLNNFYRNHDYNYITYGRNLTVGEARNHLLFIARITSEEDAGKTIEDPVEGVFVDEWGSLKDNWQRRGYPVANWARNANWGTAEQMEYYMINGNRSESFTPQNWPVKGTVDYMHTTTRNDGSEGSAYVQDWARVVPESAAGNYELYSDYEYHDGGWFGNDSWTFNYTQYVYWNESFDEKCKDVWDTFEKAIEDNNNRQGTTFYINSLDGYFVDRTIQQSYVPYIDGRSDSYTPYGASRNSSFGYGQGGMAGNIGEFATEINSYFYKAILNFGENNIYGPMNIVILDRVYEDDPSSYLPSVIINNNYRFPLLTSEDVATQSKADGSYTAGGSVWQ